MDLNPYDELGVARDATEADVRKAYRKKAKSTHPDSGGDPAEWSRVCTSLAVLTDPKKRKTFDDTGRIEEDRPDNDRAAALQIIEMHMGTICNDFIQSGFLPERDPRRMDVIKVIRHEVTSEIAEAKVGIKGGEKVVAFMRDMAKRFTQAKMAAAGEPDPIGRGLELQIRNAEEQIAGIRANVRQRELVLTILDGYRFEMDRPRDEARARSIRLQRVSDWRHEVVMIAIGSALSGADKSALYRLKKYGELKIDDEGVFSVPGKYWSITLKQMDRLEHMGLCKIQCVGQSVFAVPT
jgi:hypothetical protein